jgi:thiopurine S-methyltransferase
MDASWWRDKWQSQKIGFHEGTPNYLLARHRGHLAGRVLLPLCGKTEDLAFLAGHGHQVVGVELVEDAVRAFFTEHGVAPAVTEINSHRVYRAGAITVVQGDWFSVDRALVGDVDSFYDRAALVALPAEMRVRYIETLRRIVPAGAPGLLVTVDYADNAIDGPPFAVRDAEVRTHYAKVDLLEEGAFASAGKLKESGVPAIERCYALSL